MVLLIDSRGSFIYNLKQYLCELGADVRIMRNDGLNAADVEKMNPDHVVISPGLEESDRENIVLAIIRALAGRIPILGVGSGHQAIGRAFGAHIVPAGKVMHGKTSTVMHRGQGVFRSLPKPLRATRYHALVMDKDSLPESLEVTAWTEHDDGSIDEIMGIRHRSLAVEGVQFHPESVLSEAGYDLLANFLQQTPQAQLMEQS